MNKFNVYQIEVDGTFRKIGPECGFDNEVSAHGFAYACASDRWMNRKHYTVIRGELSAVYSGAGLPPAGEAAAISLGDRYDAENDDYALGRAV